jgi:hypothetical protein
MLAFGGDLFAADALRQFHPVDGKPNAAAITKVDTDGTLHVSADGKSSKLKADDFVRWGSFVDAQRGPQILLAPDGLIVADEVHIEGERLIAPSAVLGDLKLPFESIAGILFRPPSDPQRRDALYARIRETSGETDRVVLTNGDELTGTIHGLQLESLTLETEAGKVAIETGRLALVVFNPALLSKPRSSRESSLLGFRDGSRLTASKLSGEKTLSITLAGGLEFSVEMDQLAALQPMGTSVSYLSDLKPISYRHVPFLSLQWPYKMDRSANGNQLRVAGEVYPKGIGLHSAARLTFDLPSGADKFAAELGIDDETAGLGSVVVRVLTDDGSGKWKAAFTSPVIRGGEKPTPVEVPLSDAQRLTILVDYADHGDQQDHLDLLNARVTTSASD